MRRNFIVMFSLLLIGLGYSQSWVLQQSGVNSSLRHVAALNENDAWVVGENGVFLRTTNGGTTWVKNTIANAGLLIGCWMYKSTIGWAGGDNALYYTSDAGATWTQQAGPYLITKLWFMDAMNGYAIGGRDAEPHYAAVYKTTNGGANWTQIMNNSSVNRLYGINFFDMNNGYVNDEKGNVLKTTDGGTTWTTLNLGLALNINTVKFITANYGYVSGNTATAGYILKTTDGGTTWTGGSNQLTYVLTDIGFANSDVMWALGATQISSGFYKSTTGGSSWTLEQAMGNVSLESIKLLTPTLGWAVTGNGEIYKLAGPSDIHEVTSSIPDKFNVEQNYPNPFNPSTSIRFSVPSQSDVKVEIFSLTGELISTPFSGTIKAGSFEVTVNAGSLSSGIYVYRVSAVAENGSNIYQISKKMTVLK